MSIRVRIAGNDLPAGVLFPAPEGRACRPPAVSEAADRHGGTKGELSIGRGLSTGTRSLEWIVERLHGRLRQPRSSRR